MGFTKVLDRASCREYGNVNSFVTTAHCFEGKFGDMFFECDEFITNQILN